MPDADVVVVRGTGSIGIRHLRVLASLGVDAVAMPVRETRDVADELRGFRVARSWADVRAGRPKGSRCAAIIATDTSRHVADACAAMEAGFDVLVEKPLAARADELSALEHVARTNRRKVYVACNMRFSRGLLAFREKLPNVGRVLSVRIECQSFLPSWRPGTDYRRGYSARAAEGGVLRDLVHELDYAVWLFGRPRGVFAMLENRGELGIESEESADLLWSSSAGAAVSIRLDYVSRISRRRLHVVGERAELEWNAIAGAVTFLPAGEPPLTTDTTQNRDDMMRDQARTFLAALNGGEDPRLVSLDEGAFVVSLVDAAHSSSRSRKMVEIAPWKPN